MWAVDAVTTEKLAECMVLSYIPCMKKRIADWLEKISAGSMLIGLYQGNTFATCFGLLVICAALYLGRKDT